MNGGLRALGLGVCAYFNNDVHGHALRNTLDLRRLLQEGPSRVSPQTRGHS